MLSQFAADFVALDFLFEPQHQPKGKEIKKTFHLLTNSNAMEILLLDAVLLLAAVR